MNPKRKTTRRLTRPTTRKLTRPTILLLLKKKIKIKMNQKKKTKLQRKLLIRLRKRSDAIVIQVNQNVKLVPTKPVIAEAKAATNVKRKIVLKNVRNVRKTHVATNKTR